MSPITSAFKNITHDAVLFKANHLLTDAADPDEQAAAIDQLTTTLLCIANDIKRNAYIKRVCELHKKVKAADLKKSITAEQKRRAAAEAKKKMDAAFSKTIQ